MITYEYGQLTLKNSREKLTFRCSKEDADYIRSTALSIMSSPSTHVECADNCANSLEAAVAYNLKCGYKYLGVFDGWYLFMVKHNFFLTS